jgi:hypothetical protein
MNHSPESQRIDVSAAISSQWLADWVASWAGLYDAASDTRVLALAGTSPGYLKVQDLVTIFRWKLQPNHFVVAQRDILRYEAAHPGLVQSKTAAALVAVSDADALRCLRGLPQMKTAGTVAVASAVLMVLDPDRWSVMDKMANSSVVALRDMISAAKHLDPRLAKLAHLVGGYAPPLDNSARSEDWPTYMAICREIANLTGASLRVVDRALYKARGDLRAGGATASSEVRQVSWRAKLPAGRAN